MNFINNYVQLKYFEELAGLIVFSVILAGYGIWIAITYLRELFNQGKKNSARFLIERFYYASLRDGILALAKLS